MNRTVSAAHDLRVNLLAAAVAACFGNGVALANPTGPTVVNGAVTMASSPGVLQITNSPNSIINWQSFSINAGELTRFNQQSAASAVLNRVPLGPASEIWGTLSSNGRVFLINPNGILFGSGSTVDVAGLVASTLNLSNEDFLANRLRFTEVPGAGSVTNNGWITTPTGGTVLLVGPAVTNGGIISAPGGDVVLAAGNSVELENFGTPGLSVQITAPGNEARNLGSLVADSGRVGIFAGLINQGGWVSANGAVMGADGSIRLVATGSTNFAGGSQTMSTSSLSIDTGDLTVAGIVQSGPQTINATGAVAVRNEPGGFARLAATGGQSISARSVEVTALGGGEASIFNALSGDQNITIAGSGTGAGLDVRTLSGAGFASIWTDAGGASQRVIVSDADHITVNGSGGGSAFVSAPNGTQTVSITGVGSNAMNIGSAGAAGMSILSAAGQSVTAGANGESGSIAIVGSAANGAFSGLVSFPSAGSYQTVSTSGTLSIAGSTGLTQPAGTGVFQNGSGLQTVNAAGIVMQGGSAGSGNGAFVNSSGSQQVNAGAGGITLIGGAGGTSNSAGIFQTRIDPALTQSVAVSDGGSLMLRGGSGGASNSAVIGAAGGMQQIDVGAGGITLIGGSSTGLNNSALINQSSSNPAFTQTVRSAGGLLLDSGDAGERNFALIQAFGGLQSIDVGQTTLRSGAGGAANFAAIQAQQQKIDIHGDLAIMAGGSVASGASSGGAGIGGRGGAAPTATNLSLAVDGNLTLTGGSAAGTGASIGASPLSNDPTVMSITVGGNVVLNPGTAPGAFARIGTRAESPAGGNIDISALGSVVLNSTSPDMYSFIRTADGVTLRASGITEGSDAAIQGGSLRTETTQGANLTGANSVASFSASDTGLGQIALNNASPLLTVTSIAQGSGAITLPLQMGDLTLNQSGDLLVTGIVQSGPQAITATGALTVRSDATSSGQLSAVGGQAISARSVEVVAQDGGSAFITNNGFGDQAINVVGGGASAGLDVHSQSGSGVARIYNTVPGATQSIIVSDADHISVNGMGTGFANIFAIPGNQVISITGSGANAINLGSVGAQGASQLVALNQSIVAGAPGQAGSISLVGPAANAKPTNIVSLQGSGNSQMVSTSGLLSVTGGTAPAQNFGSGMFHNGTGPQTVNAAGIVVRGGSVGSGNGVFINSVGSQQMSAGAGGITVIGGAGETSNPAGIFQTGADPALTQSITVSDGGSLTLRGGGNGTSNNVVVRAYGGMQRIDVGGLEIFGGSGGTMNFAVVVAPRQEVVVHGDLALTGGASLATPTAGGGALLGGGAAPTNLMLTVGGNVTLNGGSAAGSGSSIGGNNAGGQRTDITMVVGGNVTLNSGAVSGTRIGSPATNLAGGEIVVNAGGAIALNSAGPSNAGAIRTTDSVTLRARETTQGPDAVIQANTLRTETQQGASLVGANAVNSLSAVNSTSGAVAFNNTSPLLAVTGIQQVPNGALSLNQTGNLLVTGDISSGAQAIRATGDFTITPQAGSGVEVHANGAQTFSAGGKFSLLGGSAWDGYALVTSPGPMRVQTGGDLKIAGGSGLLATAMLYGKDDARLTVGDALRLDRGTGLLAFARVQADFGDKIYVEFPNRASGGYFVDGREGVTTRGLDGFFTGLLPAVRGRSLILTYGH